jgi:O-antigen/teichoic acid export membrane protein
MIKKVFRQVSSNPFLKNVSTLAAGTIISQLILFISSPILTRLFSASDFGVLALFNSVAVMAAILTTGRYEFAVGLPEKNEKASNVVGLITILAFLVSLVYLVIIIFLKNWAGEKLMHNEFIGLPVVYLVPLMTYAIACFTAFQYWNQRFKSYRLIAIANSILIILGVILNIAFGLLGFKRFGLIYSLVLSQILAIGPVFFFFYKSGYFQIIKLKELLALAKEYKNFPKYMLVSDLSLTTSQQIVPVILTILFNSATVGLFALANRMLKVPGIVFTSSIGNVFRNEAIDVIRISGNCEQLYLSTLKKLIILAVPAFGFLAIFSPQLFTLAFGKNWAESGYFARLICIGMMFDFLATPLNTLFYVVNKQKLYMQLQFFNALFGILFIYLGNWIFGSAYYSVLFFSINNAFFSLLSIFMSHRLSKNKFNQ